MLAQQTKLRVVKAMGSTKLTIVVLWTFLYFIQVTRSTTVAELKREIVDHILPKHDNEIFLIPTNITNSALPIEVSIHILEISKLNEEKMEFTVDLYIRQQWNDFRLKYNNRGQFKYIVINDPNLIWTPPVYISDEMKGHTFGTLRPTSFVRIFPNGTVLCGRKISVTVYCPPDLKNFPFDKQRCSLTLSPYGLTTEDVLCVWRKENPVTYNRLMQIPLFTLEKVIVAVTDEYNSLAVYFELSRTFQHYFSQVYLPSFMFIVISWLPFWMNQKLQLGRLLINIGALFTYVLIIYDLHEHQTTVPYSTRLHCFTGTCLTFLFASLIETVVVQQLADKEQKTEVKDNLVNGDVHKDNNGKIRSIKTWIANLPFKKNIDRTARIVVPLAFLMFCIIYFSTASVSANANFNYGETLIKETLLINPAT